MSIHIHSKIPQSHCDITQRVLEIISSAFREFYKNFLDILGISECNNPDVEILPW